MRISGKVHGDGSYNLHPSIKGGSVNLGSKSKDVSEL